MKKLGPLTFWIFVIENSIVAWIGALLFFVSLVFKVAGVAGMFSSIADTYPDLPGSIDTLLNWGILGSFTFLLFGILIAFGLGAIDYYSYRFVLDENDLRIKQGIINVEEISIPYHQIQDVDIERPFFYQLLGASRLVIITERHGDQHSSDLRDESESKLPAIPRSTAESIRAEILEHADVQKVLMKS